MSDILFYPKFPRVGNMSPSGLKLLLEVKSVKWKACNIYCCLSVFWGGLQLLFMLQSLVGRRGSDCMENLITTQSVQRSLQGVVRL
jgi:hypothetical protein